MKSEKKQEKENLIIEGAEKIFKAVGFKNAKMEDIAAASGITKVTLYSYFQSKENLYLAITYSALQKLIEKFYTILNEYKSEPALNSALALFSGFMEFCESNYLYSEALLDYFSMNRSSASGVDTSKLTGAVIESIYYRKILDIQNLPYKITYSEVERGKKDGSIDANIDGMLGTLYAWTVALGYIKVINSAGDPTVPLFNVDLTELKKLNLKIAKKILKGEFSLP